MFTLHMLCLFPSSAFPAHGSPTSSSTIHTHNTSIQAYVSRYWIRSRCLNFCQSCKCYIMVSCRTIWWWRLMNQYFVFPLLINILWLQVLLILACASIHMYCDIGKLFRFVFCSFCLDVWVVKVWWLRFAGFVVVVVLFCGWVLSKKKTMYLFLGNMVGKVGDMASSLTGSFFFFFYWNNIYIYRVSSNKRPGACNFQGRRLLPTPKMHTWKHPKHFTNIQIL